MAVLQEQLVADLKKYVRKLHLFNNAIVALIGKGENARASKTRNSIKAIEDLRDGMNLVDYVSVPEHEDEVNLS